MSSVSTTVNVNPDCTVTPGTFQVRAFYTETDEGHLFGPFSTKERAESCLLVLAGRTAVIKAQLEIL